MLEVRIHRERVVAVVEHLVVAPAAGQQQVVVAAACQCLPGSGNSQRGGILVFGAVVALADAGTGRDPFVAGVHLAAQVLICHYTAGQCPAGSQQL